MLEMSTILNTESSESDFYLNAKIRKSDSVPNTNAYD